MKTLNTSTYQKDKKPTNPPRNRGIALVTTLALLTITAVLILAYFSISQNELSASVAYSRGQEAQNLSLTPVNMVIHQLRSATESTDDDELVAWASQPGMVRTWTDGRFQAAYKLYSDETMVVDRDMGQAAIKTDFEDAAKGEWAEEKNKAIYVDLNEPVIRASRKETKIYFPIVDPRGDIKEGDSPSARSEDDEDDIEGFDYVLSGDKGIGASSNVTQLPMPVKWIYVLEDGTMGTMIEAPNGKGEFVGLGENNALGSKPNRNNPIVSRFAFWADDESAKLNINTAAGGQSWDTPRASGLTDRNYGAFQPVQKEYQRYPGHPATTSLMPVIFPNRARFGQAGFDSSAMDALYGLIPRVVVNDQRTNLLNDEPPPLYPDRDRLYASIDEFIFRAPGKDNGIKLPREPHKSSSWGEITGDFLSKAQFFLTAHSRAPETTIFNTPRVSVWPTFAGDPASDGDRFSAFDLRLRFCSEVGNNETLPSGTSPSGKAQYYFQRERSDHPTHDYEGIPRNKDVYKYLQWLTSQSIPGNTEDTGSFGDRSFKDKYPDDRDQILTEMFDYIRSVNLFDDSLLAENGVTPNTTHDNNPNNHLTFTNYRQGRNANSTSHQHPGHGQVVPIRINEGTDTKGFGRYYSIREVGLGVICCVAGDGLNFDPIDAGIWGQAVAEAAASPRQYAPIPDRIGGQWRPNIKDEGDKWSPKDATDDDPVAYSNICPLTAKTPSKVCEVYDIKKADGTNDLEFFNETVIRPGQSLPGNQVFALVTDEIHWNYNLPFDEPLKATNGVPNKKVVQAILLVSQFCPSQGWTAINPDFTMDFNLSDWTLDGESLEWNGANTIRSSYSPYRGIWGTRDNGGVAEPRCLMICDRDTGKNYAIDSKYATYSSTGSTKGEIQLGDNKSVPTAPPGADEASKAYPFISPPIQVGETMDFSGGSIQIEVFAGGGIGSDMSKGELTQTVQLDMDPAIGMPTPVLNGYVNGRVVTISGQKKTRGGETEAKWRWSLMRDGAYSHQRKGRLHQIHSHKGYHMIGANDVTRSYVIGHGDDRLVAGQFNLSNGPFVKHPDYDKTYATDVDPYSQEARNARNGSNFTRGNNATGYGRQTAKNLPLVPATNAPASVRPQIPDSFVLTDNRWNDWDNTMAGELDGPYINKPDEGNSKGIEVDDFNPLPPEFGAVSRQAIPYFTTPWAQEAAGPSFWSPNRMMPGPGMFGSLPTGVKTGEPWQTLLFRPMSNDGRGDVGTDVHPGYELPKDHFLLDFFWMPVVEPWSISESVSTAGKVNLNYQIEPFRHITRTSALRGVFAPEEMLTVPNDMGRSYKSGQGWGRGYRYYDNSGGDLRGASLRSYINTEETLVQFQEKFDDDLIFRTASQICEIWLVPTPVRALRLSPDPTAENVEELWDSSKPKGLGLVGDNSRERVYTNLIPRLTTKSNTFQVHYRAQVVRQSPLSPVNDNQRRTDDEYKYFDPTLDNVVSEYRGSTVIERYIDPEDKRIPDFAVNPPSDANPQTLDDYYRFRVVNAKRFAP